MNLIGVSIVGKNIRTNKIKTLICDCDGVLNDGKQSHYVEIEAGEFDVSETGEMLVAKNKITLEKAYKNFHSRDKTAIRELVSKGVRVIIVSADESEITKAWAESCGAEFMHKRIKVFDDSDDIDWGSTAGIGDDVIDLPFLEKCLLACCPEDAHPRLQKSDYIQILPVKGGCGVISYLTYMFEKYKWI